MPAASFFIEFTYKPNRYPVNVNIVPIKMDHIFKLSLFNTDVKIKKIHVIIKIITVLTSEITLALEYKHLCNLRRSIIPFLFCLSYILIINRT